MSYWKLLVEGFGKIEKAEIELAPMTLFVGDNNSGKSYLLSLAWLISQQCGEIISTDSVEKVQSAEYREIEKIFLEAFQQADKGKSVQINSECILPQLQAVMNQILQREKEQIIQRLFNTDCVSIRKICLKMPYDKFSAIKIGKAKGAIYIKMGEFKIEFIGEVEELNSSLEIIISLLLRNYISGNLSVYMPAARTGFMMAKDVINKYARKRTYDVQIVSDKSAEVQPFSRPILDFLDIMNDLSQEQTGGEDYQAVVTYIQQNMVQGDIEISGLPGHELSYVPNGVNQKYPFRAASAVVTELAPLLLLLSHKKQIDGLFYEEPEMCLHPALQKHMGQVLVRMVNAGIQVTATTHCDIILQHVNNMVRLNNTKKNPEDYGYDSTDVIAPEHIRVYQFSNCKDGTTEVKELQCGENGFAVPTFNDALDDIMEDVIQIQS